MAPITRNEIHPARLARSSILYMAPSRRLSRQPPRWFPAWCALSRRNRPSRYCPYGQGCTAGWMSMVVVFGQTAPKDNMQARPPASCFRFAVTPQPAAHCTQFAETHRYFHVGAAKVGGGGRRRQDHAGEPRTAVERV